MNIWKAKWFTRYRDCILLGLVALPMGAVVGGICALFGRVLLLITDFRTDNPFWLIPFLALAGVVIVWCYQKFGGTSSKGMGLLFEASDGTIDKIPLRLIPMVMASTWLTHLFGGSAGREGVAVQMGGTVGHFIGRHLPIRNAGRILLIAGMAAGFGGLFRTPLAATFFAMEVLACGTLELCALVPCLVASFTASLISGGLGLGKFTAFLTDSIDFSWDLVWKLIVIGILFGICGGLFAFVLAKLKKLFAKLMKNAILRIFIIGIIVSGCSLLLWCGRYSGLGTNLIAMSFSADGGIEPWDFALKFAFTVVTLAAGFQGGEVTPLFSIGASLGILLGWIFGLPVMFVAALGYAAVFGSATNTILAPMLIGGEVFGFQYMPYFAVVCLIAKFCNGNQCIYGLQKGRTAA